MSRLSTISALSSLLAIEACSQPHASSLGPQGFSTCHVSSGGASITGTIIWDSSGAPDGERGVNLNDTLCEANTDSMGRFKFAGLPPGDYWVTVAPLWARRVAPLKVHLGPGATQRIAIRLLSPNDVLDCLDTPECAPLLAILDSEQLAALSGTDQLAEVALRTAIAMTNPQMQASTPAICLDLGRPRDSVRVAPSPAVLEILSSRYRDVHLGTDCQVASPGTSRWHLRLRDQDRPAWQLLAQPPELTSDSTGVGATEYYVGPLWAAGWACSYERHRRLWRPVRCVMKWIS